MACLLDISYIIRKGYGINVRRLYVDIDSCCRELPAGICNEADYASSVHLYKSACFSGGFLFFRFVLCFPKL